MIITVAVIVGIFCGYAAEKDWFFLTLRSLPITESLDKISSKRPVVILMSRNKAGELNTKGGGDARPKPLKVTEAWVQVRLKSGKLYEGWPEFFELGYEPSELYLSPACEWKKNNNIESMAPISGPGIIIYEREIESITFIDREKSKCIAHYFKENTEGESNK